MVDSPERNEPLLMWSNDADVEPTQEKVATETESPEGEYFVAEGNEPNEANEANEVNSSSGDSQENADDDVLSIFDPEDMELLGGDEEDEHETKYVMIYPIWLSKPDEQF